MPCASKVIVSENNTYASIRIHQERDYPGRTIGTSFCRTEAVRRAMLSLTAGWEAVYDP